MIKLFFIFFVFLNIAEAKSNIQNNLIIQKSFDFIAKKEGIVLVHTKGLGHKEKIIGAGDYICKTRYKNATKITHRQASQCLTETIIIIYKNVKKRLPNLTINQYVSIISLIFNVGYDNFYNSRLFKLINIKSKNINLIRYEWIDFSHIKGSKMPVIGLVNRRTEEVNLFFNY